MNPLASKLSQIFPHRDSAAAVGREYLKVTPLEADASQLIELIGPPKKFITARATAGAEAFADWLQAKQRDDFERGRVVLVQDWMLSRTEARLCALVALT
jgi:hypothetical protein